MLRSSLILLLLPAILWGCASVQEQAVTQDTSEEPEVVAEVAPTPPERAFPEDSVYPLLVAEFALRRRQYDVALNTYMQQADALRDRGVSAHTTHLAQFMQREPEALHSVALWSELDPDNIEAQKTLATLLVRRGRTLEAMPHLAAVARSGRDAPFPILLTGFRQLSPGQRAELVSGVNELALEFPDNAQLLLTQALIHEELDQNEQALEKLDRLFATDPYQSQAVFLEAKLLLEAGDKEPFQRIEAALDADPDDNRLRLQYARLLTQNNMEEARGQFEILSARAPEDADLLFSLALINRETGDDVAAKAYLQQMLELDERTDEAHYYLGRIAEDEENFTDAIANYRQVSGGRDFMSANNRIGRILIEQDQLQQSKLHFEITRKRYPDDAEQLFTLEAELFNQLDMIDESEQVLNEGLVQFPSSTSLLYSRSLIAEKQNDLVTMEADLRSILAQNPQNATALNALGYSLANRTDRYDEAYDLIARALELQPGEPAILDSMGWVLFRKGDYPQAINYLQQAYDKFPDPEVAAHLGEAHWANGDTEAAMTVWENALKQDPDHKILMATLQRLGISELLASP
ncbi:MAG: tetratricopeptide repeat protein [Halioglobus sp.]